MLNVNEVAKITRSAQRTLFRLETLERYEVASDGSDYRRYLDGAPEPTWERKQPWLDFLRAEAAGGRWRHRVRVIHNPPTDYERYACEWGYAYNASAGEGVRILDLADTPLPDEVTRVPDDFWLLDDKRVVLMHYGEDATFHGAEVLDAAETPRYRAARDATWHAAVEFGPWWAARPQLHRDHRVA